VSEQGGQAVNFRDGILKLGVTIMPEATYGSAAVRPAASTPQLGALTDVLHKLRILAGQNKLPTGAQPLRRNFAALRAVCRDKPRNLLSRLTESPHAGLAALTSTLLLTKG
jgi:hypothetical protein